MEEEGAEGIMVFVEDAGDTRMKAGHGLTRVECAGSWKEATGWDGQVRSTTRTQALEETLLPGGSVPSLRGYPVWMLQSPIRPMNSNATERLPSCPYSPAD